jgi:hypothetical protein
MVAGTVGTGRQRARLPVRSSAFRRVVQTGSIQVDCNPLKARLNYEQDSQTVLQRGVQQHPNASALRAFLGRKNQETDLLPFSLDAGRRTGYDLICCDVM